MPAQRDGEQRNVVSPYRALIATGYYDGPTEGFAVRGDDRLAVFELLDWDDGEDLRVFRLSDVKALTLHDLIAVADEELAEDLRDLARGAAAMSAVWVLPPQPGHAGLDDFIARATRECSPVAVVATISLLEHFDLWVPVALAPSVEAGKWLEALGLPRSGIGRV